MGKIYKFSDIVHNRVPQTKDFASAKILVLEELSKLAFRKLIYGAKVFGSVGKGTPNERSDFDLLIITQNEDGITLLSLQEIFSRIFVQTRVEIEPLIIDRQFAEAGHHTVDDMYLAHMKSISGEGNIAGQDPLDVLKPYDLSPEKVHRQYLASKLRSLKERYYSRSEDDKYVVLQRALEAPVNTGRRTLQVLSILGTGVKIDDDGKQSIINTFENTFKNTGLMCGFRFLLGKDHDYTSFLKEAMLGNISREAYENYIDRLKSECVSKAIDWESKMSEMYCRILDGTRVTNEGAITNPHRNKESHS